MFWEVLENNVIKSLQDLESQYVLNNLDFYRYLQMRYYSEQTLRRGNLAEIDTGIIHVYMNT